MSYQSICKGFYKKASSEQLRKLASLIGMRKKAEENTEDPNKAGNKPAGVGNYHLWNVGNEQRQNPNEYQKLLLNNYRSTGKDYAFPDPFPFLPSTMTTRSRLNNPILQKDLLKFRLRQAEQGAKNVFDEGTDQYDATLKYLM